MKKTLTRRRSFLKKSLVGITGSLIFPQIVPSLVVSGRDKILPGNRITLGFVGVGSHGIQVNLKNFLAMNDVQVVAVCDVDSSHLEEAKSVVESFYGKNKPSGIYRGCEGTKDFRSLVGRDDIDAVVISTPDHWHIPIAVDAIEAGKDVYCEKPLTLTIKEGQILNQKVKEYHSIFQTGSEFRGAFNFHHAAELVRNGRIGKLHTIWTYLPDNPYEAGNPEPMPVPKELDYEMWLGQAPFKPYTKQRVHWDFRWLMDYSGGQLTDWGAHLNDQAQWANDSEYTGPVEIEGLGRFRADGLFDTAHKFRIDFRYQNGVKLICTDLYPEFQGSIRYLGTEGTIFARYSGYHGRAIQTEPVSILTSKIGPDENHLYTCPDGPEKNFIDCIKSRKEPYYPAEIGHRSASVCHLGNIALQLGRKLKWDPVKEEFIGDVAANRLRCRQMRSPWTLY